MLVVAAIFLALTILALRFIEVTRVIVLMLPIAMIAALALFFFGLSGVLGFSR